MIFVINVSVGLLAFPSLSAIESAHRIKRAILSSVYLSASTFQILSSIEDIVRTSGSKNLALFSSRNDDPRNIPQLAK
jgi:ubiquinone biosynthesis protein COQ9